MAVDIQVGDNWQSVINANPAGTTYTIKNGIHRGQRAINPKAGDKFYFEPNAVMSGFKVLSGWQYDSASGKYYVGGQTQTYSYIPYITGSDGNQYWINSTAGPRAGMAVVCVATRLDGSKLWLHHVASVNDLAANTYYFDDAANRVWIGSNPSSYAQVEITEMDYAFDTGNDGLLISGGVVEGYGPAMQQGAVRLVNSANTTINGLTIRFCSANGLTLGDYSLAENCLFTYCGMQGFGVGDSTTRTGTVVRHCEVSFCNASLSDLGFSAGGVKISNTDSVIIEDSYFHDIWGVGIWADVDNVNTIIRNNICVRNIRFGIYTEIGGSAQVSQNWCGYNYKDGYYNANCGQIQIGENSNTEIFENTIIVDGTTTNNSYTFCGIGFYQKNRRAARNNHIHHNDIYVMTNNNNQPPVFTGADAYNSTSYQTDFYANDETWNNQWNDNRYHLEAGGKWTTNSPMFYWGGTKTFTQWLAYAFVTNDTLDTIIPPNIADIPEWSLSYAPATSSYRAYVESTPNILRYYPIDEVGGGVMKDAGPVGDDGTYGGVSLGQTGIPLPSAGTAGQWVRPGSYGNFLTSDLLAALDRNEFAFSLWFYITSVTWADGYDHHAIRMDSPNFLLYVRKQASGALRVFKTINQDSLLDQLWEVTGITQSGWLHIGISNSHANDEYLVYLHSPDIPAITSGIQLAATAPEIVGVDDFLRLVLGSYAPNGSSGSTMKLQHFVLYDGPKTLADFQALSAPEYPPVITNPGTINISERVPQDIQIVATGTNPLLFSATGLPAGMEVDAITGRIIGSPISGQASSSPFTVSMTATDSIKPALTATVEFQITVEQMPTYKQKIDSLGTAGPYRYYPCDEASGASTLVDYSNGHNITADDTLIFGVGGMGDENTAVRFDTANTGGIDLNDADFVANFDPDEYTISIWWRTPADIFNVSSNTHLLRMDSANFLIYLRVDADGDINWFQSVNGSANLQYNPGGGGSGAFIEDGWNNAIITRSVSNNYTAMIINGVVVASSTNTPVCSGISSWSRCVIGSYSTTTTPIGADIAHIAIFNEQLDSGDLDELYFYNEAPSITDPGPLSFYEGQNVNLAFTFSDNNAADTHTFNITGAPSGPSMVGNVFQGTIASGTAGSYTPTLYCTDSGNPNKQTSIALDITVVVAPTITNTDPADGALNIAVDKVITITFSKNISTGGVPEWVTIDGSTSGPHSFVESPSTGSSTQIVTLTPDDPFDYGETVTVTIINAGVTDGTANLTEIYEFGFQTVAGAAPTIDSTVPANSATDVALTPTIRLNFSETLEDVSVSPAFAEITGSSGGAYPFTKAGGTGENYIELTPTRPFVAGETVTVTVYGARIIANSQNMASNYVFSFAATTTPPAPVVTEVSPANNATNVAPNTDIRILWDQQINSDYLSTYLRVEGSVSGLWGLGGDENVVYSINNRYGRLLSFLDNFVYGEDVTVTVYGNHVYNDSGVYMEANYVFTFTIQDAPNPSVLLTTPANGQIQVASDAPINITFSEAVVATNPWVQVTGSSSGVIATTITNQNQIVYTLTPTSNYQLGETITVSVFATQIASVNSGANMTTNYIFTFVVAQNASGSYVDDVPVLTDYLEYVEDVNP